MRLRRHLFPEIGGGEAVTALILESIFVEVWHFRARPSASDHFDYLLTIELRRVQV